MSQIILSFDVSSTTIGFAVLEITEDNQIKFISCNHLKPIKTGTILERLKDTRDKIKKIIEEIKPNYIAIEDIIQYIKKASTATTIITLALFNRMIGLLSYDYLGKPPQLFNVLSIRHSLKLNKTLPAKEDMPELTSHHLGIKFPYIYNKKGNIQTECYDQADALAVGLRLAFELTGKLNKKKSKKNETSGSLQSTRTLSKRNSGRSKEKI